MSNTFSYFKSSSLAASKISRLCTLAIALSLPGVTLRYILGTTFRCSPARVGSVQFDPAELANLHTSVFGESPIGDDVANMDWKRFEEWTLERIIEAGFVANRTPPQR
ncbi:hypothetical protein SAMN02927923_03984 [Microvirga guangxiensis]|uniref:Uncharacterized protein n=1 Tax=Microvirga guangxiensis TaxID=549386 RepID=A0A1G5L8S5_9HYPH|nr:hypothetical protein SAMN02927923_03984 [Microvirga guangxiensis]